MSCVWQEGSLVSSGATFFGFHLVPYQCLAIEGTMLVLDTFCSSRIPKQAYCLMHKHYIFVCTGSPGFHRFSFYTNYALIRIPVIHFSCSACVLLYVSWGVEGRLQWIHGSIAYQLVVQFVGITRIICASVFVAVNIGMLCCIYTDVGKSKNADANAKKHRSQKLLFWPRRKALSMPKSIKYSSDESPCIKVWRKTPVEMLDIHFYLLYLKWGMWVWALEFSILWEWNHLYNS